MPVNVVMPQMGESVAEGTVVRWIKQIGDPVERDEPLFEISTDKVDAEIPSPAAGTLTAIHVVEGQTVPVDTVVAIIAQAGDAAAVPAVASAAASGTAAGAGAGAAPPAPKASESPDGSSAPLSADKTDGRDKSGKADKPNGGKRAGAGDRASQDKPAAAAAMSAAGQTVNGQTALASAQPPAGGASAATGAGAAFGSATPRGEMSREELRRQRSSPLVRKIAHEHNVDISQIQGSGISGRVTKQDILEFLDHRPADADAAAAAGASDGAIAARPAGAPGAGSTSGAGAPALHVPAYGAGEAVEIVPLSVMRRKIAEHMVLSRRTSAHVHSVFEVDFTHVAKIRESKKAEYERLGTKLTFLSFIAKATIDALRGSPVINASLDGDNIVYKKDINVGIAVALDWGLIVPVIKHADERNLLGLSRAIADLATRARSKQLKPEEVQGGTFTITNPGIFGAQFGMPIINQPQVAILGVGAVEKRAVVVDDAIAIRPRGYLTLGYDHRLVDGAVADQFMSQVKKNIETFDPASV
jgi:pyruvate dehydrogenase E2 component (dihydrolipoamide acetyltransferase)